MNKLRWGKFYWSDWSDDPALALCSLAAQGLWMRLLCIGAQGTPYGHMNIKGQPATVEQIAKLVRAKPSFVARLIDELERKGVVSRDASGSLVSSRQESDGKLAGIRSKAGKAGAKSRYGRDFAITNNPVCHELEEEEEIEAKPPHKPPNGGQGGGGFQKTKPSKNAHVDIAAEMFANRYIPPKPAS